MTRDIQCEAGEEQSETTVDAQSPTALPDGGVAVETHSGGPTQGPGASVRSRPRSTAQSTFRAGVRPAAGEAAGPSLPTGVESVRTPAVEDAIEVADEVEPERDAASLKARIVAGMWADGWVGTATITPTDVVETYRERDPRGWVEDVVEEMFGEEECPLRLDPEGSVGAKHSSASIRCDPVEIETYVTDRDADVLPADLAHL